LDLPIPPWRFNLFKTTAAISTSSGQAARTGHDQTLLQRQIDATDAQIGRLVYELYALTDAEIAIVEGSRA